MIVLPVVLAQTSPTPCGHSIDVPDGEPPDDCITRCTKEGKDVDSCECECSADGGGDCQAAGDGYFTLGSIVGRIGLGFIREVIPQEEQTTTTQLSPSGQGQTEETVIRPTSGMSLTQTKPAGLLVVHEDLPSPDLATPRILKAEALDKSVRVITEGGRIRQ